MLPPESDVDIILDLQTFKPVTSERNVWAFWDQGLVNCPGWVQRNVISWVRRLGPSWTVRVLDLVENSPSLVYSYVDPVHLPKAVVGNKMTGNHRSQHTSDLIRLPLLHQHGGVWIDVGMLLFRGLDNFFWNLLQDPGSQFEVASFNGTVAPGVSLILNGFLAARKGSLCIKYWHDIFLEVWKNAATSDGLHQHPLLRHLPAYEPMSSGGDSAPPSYPQFADYCTQSLCLERLRHLKDPAIGWDGPDFFENKVLLFECLTEIYWGEELAGWDGRKQFEMLGSPCENVAPGDEQYSAADHWMKETLSVCSAMKLSHGLPVTGREYLADIWNQPENQNADRKPGTFAARLRWASEHYEQTRKLTPVKMLVRREALALGGVTQVEGLKRRACEEDDVSVCFLLLDKISRSFTVIIRQLAPELNVLFCVFYLVLRGLDTIEDDMSMPLKTKEPLLRDFYTILETPGWHITGIGEREKDRELLARFACVIGEFQKIRLKYRQIIVNVTRCMGNGMADTAILLESSQGSIPTVEAYDRYCYHAAGVVVEGVIDIFILAGHANVCLQAHRAWSADAGCFLQKSNMLIDIWEDRQESRQWWPRVIWCRHLDQWDDIFRREHRQAAIHCASDMVLDLLRHVEGSLRILTEVTEQRSFNFVALRLSISMAMVELCFHNPDLFERKISVPKSDVLRIMAEASQSFEHVCGVFRRYVRAISAKAHRHADHNLSSINTSCQKVCNCPFLDKELKLIAVD